MRNKLRRMLASLALCAVLVGSLTVPASAAAFRDVPAGHWAEKEIQRCVENGFFNGQSETRFGLGQKMSRSAFAVVLCRFFGWETEPTKESTFTDVPADAWYAGAVEAAVRNGAVINARGEFRPNDPITREELAVMLVRALGYNDIAGLAQDLPMPFTDVTTSPGYITMAYDLGLVNGTTSATFAPNNTATREQVAVILMRLYDKLNGEQPETMGVVSKAVDVTGLDIAAIPAARLFSFGVKDAMDAETVAAVRTAVAEAGGKAYLYLTAGATVLGKEPEEICAMAVDAVETGGYEGLILDIPDMTEKKAEALNKLAAQLDRALGEVSFCLVTEAPGRSGKTGGYQYEALSAFVDQFILRISAVEEVSQNFAVAPVDPPEELYYGLAKAKALVGGEKVTLMLESEMKLWSKGSATTLSEDGLNKLLAAETTNVYYSDRYECAYLLSEDAQGKSEAVWYLTEDDVESRIRLAQCMGIGRVCVSDWDAAAETFLAGLN